MPATSARPEVQTLLAGLAMGESPRWHEGRLWLSDWGAQEIVAVDLDGNRETVVPVPFGLPFCIDWLPDGRLLVVSGREGLLLRREPDGSLVTHADLTGLSSNAWNEGGLHACDFVGARTVKDELAHLEVEFREAIRIQPSLAQARANLANVLVLNHDLRQAAYYFESAIRLKSDYATAIGLRADA